MDNQKKENLIRLINGDNKVEGEDIEDAFVRSFHQDRTVTVAIAALDNNYKAVDERVVIIITGEIASRLVEPYLMGCKKCLPCSVGTILADGKVQFHEEEHDSICCKMVQLSQENVKCLFSLCYKCFMNVSFYLSNRTLNSFAN